MMMLETGKKTKKIFIKDIVRVVFVLWISYGLIWGVLIFSKAKEVSQSYKDTSSVDQFYSHQMGSDRAIIIDDPLDSGLARLKIIQDAKETLDISYFAIHSGESADLFFGALFEAADRGVQVNIILDGIFHGLKKDLKDVLYALIAHPNISIKFYEPMNLWMPWTLNNRLHDKYIIADRKIVIIGGRNIGDQYFAPNGYEEAITNDRDIIIINTDMSQKSSVLFQLSEYFSLIWNHPYAKTRGNRILKNQYERGLKKGEELKNKFCNARDEHIYFLKGDMDWLSLSMPTNKVTLIHNPVQRFSKEPWCWYEITQLMKNAKKTVFIQSPYVIPNSQIVEGFFNQEDIANIEVTLLTNSLGSTPNFPAYSGYMKYRKDIIDAGIRLYEYQGIDSIHAKAFVIDDDLTLIGSFNLDPRSAYLSTETMVVIHSIEVAQKFEEGINPYFINSLVVTPDYTYNIEEKEKEQDVSQIKKILITTLSYITRLFDYML